MEETILALAALPTLPEKDVCGYEAGVHRGARGIDLAREYVSRAATSTIPARPSSAAVFDSSLFKGNQANTAENI